jgi:hypothetical protein
MSAPQAVGVHDKNRVELSLAADAQMLFLARMTGAAVASRAEFDFERVEDLRLAIDELCVRLMGAGAGPARISLLFHWDEDGTMEVVGSRVPEDHPSGNGHDPQPGGTLASYELSERILDALVDSHGEDMIGGVQRAWLRMRRQDPLA